MPETVDTGGCLEESAGHNVVTLRKFNVDDKEAYRRPTSSVPGILLADMNYGEPTPIEVSLGMDETPPASFNSEFNGTTRKLTVVGETGSPTEIAREILGIQSVLAVCGGCSKKAECPDKSTMFDKLRESKNNHDSLAKRTTSLSVIVGQRRPPTP